VVNDVAIDITHFYGSGMDSFYLKCILGVLNFKLIGYIQLVLESLVPNPLKISIQ